MCNIKYDSNLYLFCKKCNTYKYKEEFYNNKKTKTGKMCMCKKCKDLYKSTWQKNNPKCYFYSIKWNNNNKEKVKEYKNKFKSKINYSEYNNNASKKSGAKATKQLHKCYVIKTLLKKGFLKQNINNEIIEVQKIIIKTKRLCKTLQNSELV